MNKSIALREVEIFSDLTAEEILQLSNRLHPHNLGKDEVLFKEGDEGQELLSSKKVISE